MKKSPGRGASNGWQQLCSLLCAPLPASPGCWGEMGPLPPRGVRKGSLGRFLVPGMALWRWRTGRSWSSKHLSVHEQGQPPAIPFCSSRSFPHLAAPVGQALSASDYLSRRTWLQAPHSFQPSAALSPRQALPASAIARGSGQGRAWKRRAGRALDAKCHFP